jgi:hypothetical protein
MEATCPSEMSVGFRRTARHYISADRSLQFVNSVGVGGIISSLSTGCGNAYPFDFRGEKRRNCCRQISPETHLCSLGVLAFLYEWLILFMKSDLQFSEARNAIYSLRRLQVVFIDYSMWTASLLSSGSHKLLIVNCLLYIVYTTYPHQVIISTHRIDTMSQNTDCSLVRHMLNLCPSKVLTPSNSLLW